MEKVRLSEPIFLLDIVGLSPVKTDTFSLMRRIFTITVYIASVLILLAELFCNYKNVETLSRASETLFAQYALGWKIGLFVYYKKELAEIVEHSKSLWDLSEFGPNYAEEFASTHKFLRKFFRIYSTNLFILCAEFTIIPLFSDKPAGMMFYGENDPGNPAAYRIFVHTLHAIYMFAGWAIVAGFDCLFFYFIGHSVSELRMLTVSFSARDIGKKWTYEERFRISVEHHINILKFVGKISRTYSTMLLNQHMCCLFGICFGIFLMTKDGIPPDLDHFSKYLLYISTYVLQTWTYCFAGDVVIDWSSKIPNEIFYDNWEDDNSFKNGLSKIIALKRAQKAARVTLGGFGDLDIVSFNFVIRNAVNFFMFMDTMYHGK